MSYDNSIHILLSFIYFIYTYPSHTHSTYFQIQLSFINLSCIYSSNMLLFISFHTYRHLIHLLSIYASHAYVSHLLLPCTIASIKHSFIFTFSSIYCHIFLLLSFFYCHIIFMYSYNIYAFHINFHIIRMYA